MVDTSRRRAAAAARARRRSAGVAERQAACALLLVDVINPMSFDGAQAFEPAIGRTAVRIAAFKARWAARGAPVVYVNDRLPGPVWRCEFGALVEHCRALGGSAAALARALAPGAADHTLIKPRHSAFFGTPLELLLAELGVQQLAVCGLATDACVQHTAIDAFQRGYRLWIPGDCVQAESAARHRSALAWMALALQAHTAPAFRR